MNYKVITKEEYIPLYDFKKIEKNFFNESVKDNINIKYLKIKINHINYNIKVKK